MVKNLITRSSNVPCKIAKRKTSNIYPSQGRKWQPKTGGGSSNAVTSILPKTGGSSVAIYQRCQLVLLTFRYSEKGTKFCEISTLDLSFDCMN